MSEPPKSAASSSQAFDPSQWSLACKIEFLNNLESRVEALGASVPEELKGKNVWSWKRELKFVKIEKGWMDNDSNRVRCDQALEETVGKLYGVAEPSDTQVSDVIDALTDVPFDLGAIGPSEQATIAGASKEDQTKVPSVPSKGQ